MSETTDVVDRQIAAFRARDLGRFLDCYDPDVQIRDFDGNVLMTGRTRCAVSTDRYFVTVRSSPWRSPAG